MKFKRLSIILTAIMIALMVLPLGGTCSAVAQDSSRAPQLDSQTLSQNVIDTLKSPVGWDTGSDDTTPLNISPETNGTLQTSGIADDLQSIDFPDTNEDGEVFLTETGTTGNLTGRVLLEGRTNPLGVTVILGSRNVTTDTQGNFAIDNIGAGTGYVLTASMPGFLSAQRSSLEVVAGQTQKVSQITLPAGDANGDHKIDALDLAAISSHFNTVFASADLNGDNLVDIYDLTLAGKNLDKTGPISWMPDSLLKWAKLNAAMVDVGSTYDQQGAVTPAVVGLPDGSFRMYYSGFDGACYRILSANSTDLSNWNKEPGIRINTWGEYNAVFFPGLVKLSGGYRMYFSARSTSGNYGDIFSAFSEDGLAWQVETGIRIAHGGAYDSIFAQSSSLVKNTEGTVYQFPDGKYRMFYAGYDGVHFRILSASSSNGLAWNKEGVRLGYGTAISANHLTTPRIIRLPNGNFRIFFTVNLGSMEAVPLVMGDNMEAASLVSGIAPTAVPSNPSMKSATSTNGLNWTLDKGNRLKAGSTDGLDSGGAYAANFQKSGEGYYYMYYTGVGADGKPRILSAVALDANGETIISNLQVSAVSVAEKQITFDYDFGATSITSIASRPYWGVYIYRNDTWVPDAECYPIPVGSTTAGTVTLNVYYRGETEVSTNQVEIVLLNRIGPECVPGQPCAPMYLGAYSETFDSNINWRPASGGEIIQIRPEEISPREEAAPNGPYLNVKVGYSYYHVQAYSATIDVQVLDASGNPIEGFVSTPKLVLTGEGAVTIPISYSGQQNKFSYGLRADMHVNIFVAPLVTEASQNYSKTWTPSATGYFTGSGAQSAPDQYDINLQYEYHSPAGLRGKIVASVKKYGAVRSDFMQQLPCPLTEGTGNASIRVRYTGSSLNMVASELVLELSTIESVVYSLTIPITGVTWQPREGGLLQIATEKLAEPVPKGPELRVPVSYRYDSPGDTSAQIVAEVIREGQVLSHLHASPHSISPSEDTQQTVLIIQHDGTVVSSYISDQLRVRMVGSGGQVIDEHAIDYQKSWTAPPEGAILAHQVTRPNIGIATIEITYSYQSERDEVARLVASAWNEVEVPLPGGVGTRKERQTENSFYHKPVLIEEGTHTISFNVLYNGSTSNFVTHGLTLELLIGSLSTMIRLGDSESFYSTQIWSPLPLGTLRVTGITSEGSSGRKVYVGVNYTCLANVSDNPAIRVDVLTDPETVAGGFGTAASRTSLITYSELGNTTSIPIEYSGIVLDFKTAYFRVTMLVKGIPVTQNGVPLSTAYAYSKEWYTDAPGLISEPTITVVSPREVSLVADFSYFNQDIVLVPSIRLLNGDEEVTSQFVINILPALINVPTEETPAVRKLAARIWYSNLAELQTDAIEIRLKNTSGQPLLAKEFMTEISWQQFDLEIYRKNIIIDNFQVSRPDPQTISVSARVSNGSAGLYVWPMLWINNMPGLDKASKTKPNEELFSYTPYQLKGGAAETIQLKAIYTPDIGEMDVNAICLLVYSGDKTLYSCTFNLSQPEHIVSPTSILDIQYDTRLFKTTGELLVSVSYFLPWTTGPSYRIHVTPGEEMQEPYSMWPLEPAGPDIQDTHAGPGVAVFRFHKAFVSSDPLFIDPQIEFTMRHLNQAPVSRKTLQIEEFLWDPKADIENMDNQSTFNINHSFPSRIELYNISYDLDTDCGYALPVFIGASATLQGYAQICHKHPGETQVTCENIWAIAPSASLALTPVKIEHYGPGTISLAQPIILDCNGSGEDDLRGVDLKLFMYSAEGELPFYVEMMDLTDPLTFTPSPDSVTITSITESQDKTQATVHVEYNYVSSAIVGKGKVKLSAQGLKFGRPMDAFSEDFIIPNPGSGEADLIVKYHGADYANFTTEMEVVMEAYKPNGDRKKGLARTEADYKTVMHNQETYIMAFLDQIEILKDHDSDGYGEVKLAVVGVTTDYSQSDIWPLGLKRNVVGGADSEWNADWHEVDDNSEEKRTLETNLPLFCRPQYLMGSKMGLFVGAIEDDSMPSWVSLAVEGLSIFVQALLKMYGQAEAAEVVDQVTDFVVNLMAAASTPDLVDAWGTMLTQPDGWGVKLDQHALDASGVFKEGRLSGDFVPKISVKRVTLPEAPLPVTVKLKKIVTHDCGDDDEGEIRISTRVYDGVNQAALRTEFQDWENIGNGRSMSDGETWDIPESTYYLDANQEIYSTAKAGPYLYIEVNVWDEDDPSAFQDHDMLGIFTWRYTIDELIFNLGARNKIELEKTTVGCHDGAATVYLEITSP